MTERTRGFLILLASVLAVLCAVLLIVLLSKSDHSKPTGGVTSPRYKVNEGNVVDNWVVFQVRAPWRPVRVALPQLCSLLGGVSRGVGRLIFLRATQPLRPRGLHFRYDVSLPFRRVVVDGGCRELRVPCNSRTLKWETGVACSGGLFHAADLPGSGGRDHGRASHTARAGALKASQLLCSPAPRLPLRSDAVVCINTHRRLRGWPCPSHAVSPLSTR